MRRLASFVLHLAMISSGVTAIIWVIFFPHGGKDLLVIVGAAFLGIGLNRLWADFLLPAEKRRSAEVRQ